MKPTPRTVPLGLAIAALVIVVDATTVRAQGNGPTYYQTANIIDFGTGMPASGAATLFRSNNSVSARIAATGLDTNAAYTVWWIIWNNPSLCSAPCGEDDLGISGNSVFYATGFVTGPDGAVNATAYLDAGKLPSGMDVLIPGGLRSGNGLRAEIHMIIRSHGPIIPGMTAVQIGTFEGACNVNVCEDQQAVAFAPAL